MNFIKKLIILWLSSWEADLWTEIEKSGKIKKLIYIVSATVAFASWFALTGTECYAQCISNKSNLS